jgi:hypothetical protein
MSSAKKTVMCAFFRALPALLSACGSGDDEERVRRRQIGKEAQEKAKRFEEWQKSGKQGPPPLSPPTEK